MFQSFPGGENKLRVVKVLRILLRALDAWLRVSLPAAPGLFIPPLTIYIAIYLVLSAALTVWLSMRRERRLWERMRLLPPDLESNWMGQGSRLMASPLRKSLIPLSLTDGLFLLMVFGISVFLAYGRIRQGDFSAALALIQWMVLFVAALLVILLARIFLDSGVSLEISPSSVCYSTRLYTLRADWLDFKGVLDPEGRTCLVFSRVDSESPVGLSSWLSASGMAHLIPIDEFEGKAGRPVKAYLRARFPQLHLFVSDVGEEDFADKLRS